MASHTVRLVSGSCAMLLSACVAGCAQTPPAAVPPETLVESYATRTWSDARLQATLAALGFDGVSAPADELTAGRLLAAALTFNPELDVERARIDTAHAVVRQAQERANPTLSLNPERVIDA